MNKIQIINYIETFENIMCIYRNHQFFGQRKKYFIMFHVFIELSLYLLMLANNIRWVMEKSATTKDVQYFYYFLCFNIFLSDVICTIYGIYKGGAYKKFVTSLLALHNIYKNEMHYIKNLNQIKIIFLTTLATMFIISVAFITMNTISLYMYDHVSVSTLLLSNFSILHSEVCFTLEYLVIYTFLSLLSNILRSLNGTLTEIQEQVQKEITMCLEINEQNSSSNFVTKIHQLSELYKCVVELSNQLFMCFKTQVNMNSMVYSFKSFSDKNT